MVSRRLFHSALCIRGGTRETLTDLHPNVHAFETLEVETNGDIRGERGSVAANKVPAQLVGFRTMFTAFHHLPPTVAKAMLADAVAKRQGIAIFESTTRSARTLVVMLLVPLMVWLTTPLIRPFRVSLLMLTYLIPVIPLVALFDGIVSSLRTYTPDQLRELAAAADHGNHYTWSAGTAGRGPIPMTYLIGRPSA